MPLVVRYESALLKSKIPPATRRISITENPDDAVSDATFLMGSAGSSLVGAGRRLRAAMMRSVCYLAVTVLSKQPGRCCKR